MARIFTYAPDLEVVCEYQDKRSGFNHIGKVFYRGNKVFQDKMHYINRTWEAYTYQTILKRCEEWIDNNLKLEKFKKIA